MKRLRKIPFLVPIVLCTSLELPAQAQVLTALAKSPVNRLESVDSNFKPLADILGELEKRYKVSFNYDSELISKKYADAEALKASGAELEKVLLLILDNQKLTSEKINDSTYLILPRAEQPREATPVKAATQIEKSAAITVTGRVTDENGEGLPGVTVALRGTSVGGTTNAEGNYTLAVPDGQENGVLAFSFVGYVTQEVQIGNRTTINVQLAPDNQVLDEVVVIGYQTVRKSDLTGAVSVINPEAANRVTSNSVAESIQGLAPGVTVRNGGAPGQMARIEIRGAASFTNTDPLYVIDGMIADANTTINQNDIESIQILKDASAAAIYGSRAANGVIIITTRQGKEGPAKVNFSAKYGIQQVPKRWDMMNSAEFAELQRIQYENSGLTPPTSVGSAYDPNVDTDWQDEVLRTGNMQDYNLSISGGSNTSNYLVSGSYFNNTGVLIGNSFERGSLRVNTRSQKGRVTFGENMVITNTIAKSPGEGNPFLDMPQMLPVIPVRGSRYITESNPEGWGIGTVPDASFAATTYAWNPLAVNSLASSRNNYAKLVGNAYADVKILDWLNYKFNAGAEVSFDHNSNIRKIGIWQMSAAPRPSSINEARSRFLSLLFEHTVNFNKTLGAHNINGVLGYTQQHTSRETTAAGRTNLSVFNNEYFTTIGSATGDPSADGGRPVDYRIYGYLGRINYTYNDKYLLTLTGRVDQDSRFGENYRTGFFPSVAASWRISNEDFFDVAWVSDLKINASYGELGIVTVGSWDYTSYINNSPIAVFGPDQNPYFGAYQAALANPDLRWEERVVKNIGLDASLLNNRVSLSLELYNSLSKDALLRLPVAGYLGNLTGDPFVNAGSIRNTGIEVSATYRNSVNDFKWDVSANITTIKNKVESVGRRAGGIDYITAGDTRTQVGRSLGEWFVLKTDGLFQSYDEINNYRNADGVIIQPNAQPGDIRYIDLNGDGTINDADRTFAGSPWPTLQSGAQFNAAYKQLTLNVQLIGVFGNTIYNGVRRELDDYTGTNFRRDISPWSPTNTNTTDPRIGVLEGDPGIDLNNRSNTDRWLENGSYVRLRNVELGYNLPANLLGRAGITNSRLFVSGQNLFTITKYTGLDPDVVGSGILERGLDNGNWPASRVISVGIQGEF